MACPLCGEVCTCSYAMQRDPGDGAHTTVLIDPDALDSSEQEFAVSLETPARIAGAEPAAKEEPVLAAAVNQSAVERLAGELRQEANTVVAPASWRDEVAARVNTYRSRRRRRLDPDASLRLDFGAASPPSRNEVLAAEHAERQRAQLAITRLLRRRRPVETEAAVTKIIEFPKLEAPVEPARPAFFMPPLDQLAEPVLETPRILEAPEPEEIPSIVPAVPAMSLEEEGQQPPAPAAEVLELPYAPASFLQRGFAALVDALIVLTAAASFAMIAVQIAGEVPRGRPAVAAAVALLALLWCAYQYLFLVLAATTPGLELARLGMCSFEGGPLPRADRRSRALAMIVAFAPLGLGFLWALFDENALGWHDRISRSYVVSG